MTRDGCPLCGTPGHACGQPFTGTPFDLPRTEATVVGEVKRYRVAVNGTETVLKLTAEDAKRYEDAVLVAGQTADTAAGDAVADSGAAEEKAVTPENKSRTAQNKSRGAASKR